MSVKAYNGHNKYIFVSYAHVDKIIVYKFIECLQKKYNVWFDDGIHVGKDYKTEIMEHISNCELFLFLVSKNSLESEFCKKEIYFAESRKKRFINILIDDYPLPDWFEFDYGHLQHFPLYGYQSTEEGVDELIRKSSTWFDDCKIAEEKIIKEEPKTYSYSRKLEKKAPSSEPSETEKEVKRVIGDFEIVGDTLVNYHGKNQNIIVPNGIKTIGKYAFHRNFIIISVALPNSVTKIERSAFSQCVSLSSINLSFIVEIEDAAFSGCKSLSSLDFRYIEKIGERAFENCTSLRNVNIEGRIRRISKEAFKGCSSLVDVNLGDSVVYIGESAFENCFALVSIIGAPKLNCIEKRAFFDCHSLLLIYLSKLVVKIGREAFKGCHSITIRTSYKTPYPGWEQGWNPDNCPVIYGIE